ncbi:MAG: NrfD/PsrC family molybdoenzyme membrane anchor subunit, partial [Chloroflexota bacterium]|nr:NrfD/PsrC family molybdoenzyme membrane anchor subunit [Chloroflexota bacterium]
MTVLPQQRSWFSDKILMGQTLPRYLRSLLTPFNVIAALIVGVGLWLSVLRYWHGLGAVTNLTDSTPWGLWIGFDVLVGVSLAGGGYMLASAVYIFRLEQYRPVVRPAILTGFLGYFFVAVAILFDLGRPWRLPYPFFYMGVMSVMFLIAWHV